MRTQSRARLVGSCALSQDGSHNAAYYRGDVDHNPIASDGALRAHLRWADAQVVWPASPTHRVVCGSKKREDVVS